MIMSNKLNNLVMKNVFKTLMLPTLLIVAACSNDTDEMMSARQSDEPTEKEMLQTQVKEIAEQYGVLVGFNEERWQKKLPSIVDLRQAIVDHVEMVSSRDSIPMAKRRISSLDYYSLKRVKTRMEIHAPVSGDFTCIGTLYVNLIDMYPEAYAYSNAYRHFDVDATVYWTDGGSSQPNSVLLTATIFPVDLGFYEYGYTISVSQQSCSNAIFYGLHHSFIASCTLSSGAVMHIEYFGNPGVGVISIGNSSIYSD